MKGEYLILLLEFLERFIKKEDFLNRKIIIFGANAPGTIIINYLEQRGVNVEAVIDNNSNAQGKLFMDIPIQSPNTVLSNFQRDFLILISSRYYEEMKKQLEQLGYIENKHFIKTIELSNSIKFSLDNQTFENAVNQMYKGFEVYNSIKQKFNIKYIVMVPVRPNGDVYIVCSYLREFAKKLNVKINEIVLTVIGGACFQVAKLFDIPNIENLSLEDSNNLAAFSYINSGEIKLINPYFSHLTHYSDFDGYKGINFVDDIKLGIMDLNENTEPYFPSRKEFDENEVDDFFIKNELEENNTVILAPYANSIPQIKWDFWVKIYNQLEKLGFNVCTNCGTPHEKPIGESKSVFFKFKDAAEICNKAGYVISYRSGFCDVIANSNAKRVVIYPDHATGLSGLHEVFEMKDKIYNQNNLYEVVHSYENTDLLLDNVINLIKSK